MGEIGAIVSAISVLIAGGATLHLGVGIWSEEGISSLTARYAISMIYTALYAVLFSIAGIIQAVAKLIGGA